MGGLPEDWAERIAGALAALATKLRRFILAAILPHSLKSGHSTEAPLPGVELYQGRA